MNIKERYKPYNFSATKCHVIVLRFPRQGGLGFYGIEEKLPAQIKTVKGIYVTCRVNSIQGFVGGVLIGFNEAIDKCYTVPIYNSKLLQDCSHPLLLNEEISTNGVMQGWFSISQFGDVLLNGTVTIYLHYIPRNEL